MLLNTDVRSLHLWKRKKYLHSIFLTVDTQHGENLHAHPDVIFPSPWIEAGAHKHTAEPFDPGMNFDCTSPTEDQRSWWVFKPV